MNSIEVLMREIADLQTQIEIRKGMIAAYHKGLAKAKDPSFRFYNRRPLDAIRTVLGEFGGRIQRSQLEDILRAGGLLADKKRKEQNLRISVNLNLNCGNLREVDGFIEIGDGTPLDPPLPL